MPRCEVYDRRERYRPRYDDRHGGFDVDIVIAFPPRDVVVVVRE